MAWPLSSHRGRELGLRHSTLIGLAGGGLLPAEAAEAASALGGEARRAGGCIMGAAEAALGGPECLGSASAIGMLSGLAPGPDRRPGIHHQHTAGLDRAQLPRGRSSQDARGVASAARNSAGFGAPRLRRQTHRHAQKPTAVWAADVRAATLNQQRNSAK